MPIGGLLRNLVPRVDSIVNRGAGYQWAFGQTIAGVELHSPATNASLDVQDP